MSVVSTMEKLLVILLVTVAGVKTVEVESNISIYDLCICSVLSRDQFSQTIFINCSHLNITNLNNISPDINIINNTKSNITNTSNNSITTTDNTIITTTDNTIDNTTDKTTDHTSDTTGKNNTANSNNIIDNTTHTFDTTETPTNSTSETTKNDISRKVVGLDLSGNMVMRLEGELVASLLASLTSLDLSQNQLTSAGLTEASLQPAGAEKSNLRILNLSHNQIDQLPATLFAHLDHLETLDLSFNPLGELDSATISAIGAVSSLQFLDLQGCGLRALQEEMMAGLTQLRTLDISSNHFTRIDPSIRATPVLTSLIVDNNDLELLDETSFQGLDQLHNLSVSHNQNLSIIEADTFSRLVDLEDLRLSHNPGLYWVHPGAWAGEDSESETVFSLKVFSLNNNSLTYLPSMLLPTFRDWSHIQVRTESHCIQMTPQCEGLSLVSGPPEQPLAV